MEISKNAYHTNPKWFYLAKFDFPRKPYVRESWGIKENQCFTENDFTIFINSKILTKIISELKNDNVFIDDLGSTNGCLLNGSRVARAKLSHGDVLQIGSYQFTYFAEDDQIYEPTMFLQAELEETKIIDNNPKATPQNTGEKLGAVQVLSGPLKSKQLELRKPFNTLGFNGTKLAMIARNASNYTISAIKHSSNKSATPLPTLNGNAIDQNGIVLKENDILELANVQMKFIYLD